MPDMVNGCGGRAGATLPLTTAFVFNSPAEVTLAKKADGRVVRDVHGLTDRRQGAADERAEQAAESDPGQHEERGCRQAQSW